MSFIIMLARTQIWPKILKTLLKILPDKTSWGVFSCIRSAGNCQQQTKWVAAIYSLPTVCHHIPSTLVVNRQTREKATKTLLKTQFCHNFQITNLRIIFKDPFWILDPHYPGPWREKKVYKKLQNCNSHF
jgi:hypothetical protein